MNLQPEKVEINPASPSVPQHLGHVNKVPRLLLEALPSPLLRSPLERLPDEVTLGSLRQQRARHERLVALRVPGPLVERGEDVRGPDPGERLVDAAAERQEELEIREGVLGSLRCAFWGKTVPRTSVMEVS